MIARVEHGTTLAKDFGQRLKVHDIQEEDAHSDEENRGQSTEQGNTSLPRPETIRRITHPDSTQTNPELPRTGLRTGSEIGYTPSPSIASATSATSAPILAITLSRPRNKSPYRSPYAPRPHLRSRSSGSAVAPPMAPRAHSSSSVPTFRPSAGYASLSPSASPRLNPSSPMPSPGTRSLSPFQYLYEDAHPASATTSPSYDGAIGSISEDAELDLTPRNNLDHIPQPIPLHATLNSARPLSVRRQRPTSPLHSLGNAPYPTQSRSSSGASSPSIPAARFTENYPTLNHYASNSSFSSVPSTPTSARSRSPSVSSLDTIEDEPDLEWEAIEADRAAKQKAAEEAEKNGGESESKRRGSLDIPGARSGVGFGFGRRGDNKKRWSVCGGERRADLDLETIWED